MTDTEKERDRCARICDGMALAIRMGGGSKEWSEQTRSTIILVAEWLRDEILKRDECD